MDRDDWRAVKALSREEEVDALRDGRKNRASTFPNGKKKADKEACRKGKW